MNVVTLKSTPTELETHPLANVLPLLEGAAFEAFVESMRGGQNVPIILYEGKILDGRNRYRACIELGFTPKTVNLSADVDPLDIVTADITRRHLTVNQKAFAMAQFATFKRGVNQHRVVDAHAVRIHNLSNKINEPAFTEEECARLAGCKGRRLITYAKYVLENGTTEEKELIRKGRALIKTIEQQIKERLALANKVHLIQTIATPPTKTPASPFNVPEGKSATEWIAEGASLEKTEGCTEAAAAKRIGLPNDQYRQARDILLLHERPELTPSDQKAAQESIRLFEKEHRLSDAYSLVQPIIEKLFGDRERGEDRATAPDRRLEEFRRKLGILASTCTASREMKIPYLSEEEVHDAIDELKAASGAMRAILLQLNKMLASHNEGVMS